MTPPFVPSGRSHMHMTAGRQIVLGAAFLVLVVLVAGGCRGGDQPATGGSGSTETTGAPQVREKGPNYDGVIGVHRAILEKDPHNLAALIGLGNALYDAGRWDEAISAYQQALQINPHSADTITDMGTCYRKLGMFDEAINAYSRALQVEPAHQEALVNLGIVYGHDKKDYAKAIAVWERLLDVAPKHPRADEIRAAMAKFRAGRKGEAQ